MSIKKNYLSFQAKGHLSKYINIDPNKNIYVLLNAICLFLFWKSFPRGKQTFKLLYSVQLISLYYILKMKTLFTKNCYLLR